MTVSQTHAKQDSPLNHVVYTRIYYFTHQGTWFIESDVSRQELLRIRSSYYICAVCIRTYCHCFLKVFWLSHNEYEYFKGHNYIIFVN